LTGTVDVYTQNSENWVELFTHHSDTNETLLAEWENFLESVNKKSEPFITGEDGLRVVEVIEAARKSAATGCQVVVNKTPLYSQTTP
jgi:predicted dehydrogenase